MSARETIRNVLLVHYADSPNPALVVDTLMANDCAEVLGADGQAYDGELAMLRGLVRTLRVVVRPDDDAVDVAEVRRLLHEHASDDAAARAEADTAPAFFQPGRTYAYDADGFTAPELITAFRVVATTTHPETGERAAFGWIRTAEDVAWSPYSEPADEWPACWTDVTEAGEHRG
jgi:hypothetical protein